MQIWERVVGLQAETTVVCVWIRKRVHLEEPTKGRVWLRESSGWNQIMMEFG